MANSAKTITLESYNKQPGVVGRMRAVRTKVAFGADYASAVLPLITAKSLGLSEVVAVIVEAPAAGTAAGATVLPAINATAGSVGLDFTLKLFNGTTAIGTVDESGTTCQLLVLGY